MKRFCINYCISLLLFIFSCKTDKHDLDKDSLAKENQKLIDYAEQKDSTINVLIQIFNDIEENLSIIKERERIVSINRKDSEFEKTKQDQILIDISLINDLMLKNKKQMAILKDNLKKSGYKITEFEKMIDRLTEQIEKKDIEINNLKNELAQVNAAFKDLFDEYNARLHEMELQSEELNTAYYTFGTFKELKENGILTKEGGLIVGGSQKLKENFKKDYFSKVDISLTTIIPISAKKARIVTSHPSQSYRLEGTERVDKLVILNPKEFWSVSKYLVIVVE